MPHGGCRQNRSAVHWTPVPLGRFQPGTRRAPRESWLASELVRGQTPKPLKYGSQNRLATGLLHESHKRADRTLGGSTLGLPSGVLHEGHKRADRTIGGSTLGLPSGVLHKSHERGDRTIGGSTRGFPPGRLQESRRRADRTGG